MNKKFLMIALVVIVMLTGISLLAGYSYDTDENQKQNDLAETYALSSTNQLAYILYDQGKPAIYLSDYDGKKAHIIEQKTETSVISSLAFSADGKTLLYIVNDKSPEEENLNSQLFEYNLQTKKTSQLLSDQQLNMTEAIYSHNKQSLYLLAAGTYKNYSPIAPKNPHNFNVVEYKRSTNTLHALTQIDSYSIDTLTLSQNGENLYFAMFDDALADTPEKLFEAKEQIFQLSLKNKNKITKVPLMERNLYTFAVSPNEKEFIIQAVTKESEDSSLFIYELFSYNLTTKTEKQITHTGHYTSSPIYTKDRSRMYFMTNSQFGKSKDKYAIHYLDLKTKKIVQVK